MYLVTPSLLNSINYYLSVESEDAEELQRKKIISTLKREPFKQTEAMKFGCTFEDKVRELDNSHKFIPLEEIPEGPEFDLQRYATQILAYTYGGTWQMRCHKRYKDFYLYGRMDVVKGPAIYDIKTTSYYNIGKYRDSSQHKLYLYCTNLEYCEYLVVEVYHGVKEVSFKSFSVERYTKRDIEPMIHDFIGSLDNDKELKKLYFDNWKSKYD